LLRISILIRKATPRDRFAKALDGRDSPFIDQFDINYVGERFPKLGNPKSRWLCECLGRGITKCQHFLRYTRDHGAHIASDPEVSDPGDKDQSSAPPKKDSWAS